MKNLIWPIIFALVFLASCRSSRFMQDDMYFSNVDALREIREYTIYKNEKNANTQSLNSDTDFKEQQVVSNNSDYYTYSYSSRIRRFDVPHNTWAYYDPYYTNYYWYNNSDINDFGNSVYVTYSWWGSSDPMYYNSYDNNCYVSEPTNFVTLMQKNGITRDVLERPGINYTAIWRSNDSINLANNEKNHVDSIITSTYTPVVINNSKNTTNTNDKTSDTNPNNITYKRWDNSNTDVNISPNHNNTDNNWSRSGVFSEGSRNNNYQYKGSTINNKGTNKKKEDNKNNGTTRQ